MSRSFFLLSFLILSASGCSSLLYQPSRTKFAEPHALHLDYEEVKFSSLTPDRMLGGWYFPAKAGVKPRGIFVFFHGNAENLSSHFLSLAWLPQHGFEFFIFDYEGYGPSEGDPSPEGTVRDGIAAMRWSNAKAKQKGIPLLVFGQSLGGCVAMRTVLETRKELDIRWVVIDSSFQSYQSVGASVLGSRWITWPFQPLAYLFLSDRWSPEDHVADISPIPMLVIHGTEDRTVPFRLGQELFQDARDPKEFWEIRGGHHIDVFTGHDGKYRKRFLDQLNRMFPGK